MPGEDFFVCSQTQGMFPLCSSNRSRKERQEVEQRWMAGHQKRWRGAQREFEDNQLVNRFAVKCQCICMLIKLVFLPRCLMCRFVTEGDVSISRDADAGQQGASAGGENAASASADPNLYQKCYDYYMNFYRYVEVIDSGCLF